MIAIHSGRFVMMERINYNNAISTLVRWFKQTPVAAVKQRTQQTVPSLLEKEEGTMESMVQRVVRQVRETKITKDITIATNAAQFDIITSQLGESVSVVTEPERRDTFPAIALAASYLKFSKCCANTYVINEFQLPVYVDGLKDVVVVASHDGILVCGKEYS